MRFNVISSILILSTALLQACRPDENADLSLLDKAERMLASYPDSSLAITENLKPESLASRKEKARLALIHSIALDKNYIDLTDDSIISYAADYYLRKGNSLDKIRSCYYTARIHENSGEYEECMKWLLKAEKEIGNCTDKEFPALVHAAKGRIYMQNSHYEEALDNFNSAAAYNLEDGNVNYHIWNRLNAAKCQIILGNRNECLLILDSVRGNLHAAGEPAIELFYSLMIQSSEQPEAERIGIYLERVHPALIDWQIIADAYIRCGNGEQALEALDNLGQEVIKDEVFHYLKGKAYTLTGNHRDAVEEYEEYIRLSGESGSRIISNDTRFLEERQRHNDLHRQDALQKRNLRLSMAVILLALCLSVSIIASIRRKIRIKDEEQRELKTKIDMLLEEQKALSRIETFNEEGRRIISERLSLIDGFVVSKTLNDKEIGNKAAAVLQEIIDDREEFIRETRIVFAHSSPRFMKYLVDNGLTEKEIEHCCLYAIGLNGKMVTNFTRKKRHYHMGSEIRKKLGLDEHDTNLSIHIRRKLKELG